MSKHAIEINKGHRFDFGENWLNFLTVLDDQRISEAVLSLKNSLDINTLAKKKFLDVGSGSGLFSLAARSMGASVHSFDFDPKSVACTLELRRRFFKNDKNWLVNEASVLNKKYLNNLGKFDIVYSWGVLHHTGSMWKALDNILPLVKKRGLIFIAIYNDQGRASTFWLRIKKLYCSSFLGRILVKVFFYPYFALGRAFNDLNNNENLFSYSKYKKSRGMSVIHNWVDWLGGLPFEVAKPEEVFDFLSEKGFILKKIKTCAGGLGCNEYIFVKL
jgi:2-polyprenyl-3-methyl-5-hydroxy-6-metoxy-1,4-benzoquinol methylase